MPPELLSAEYAEFHPVEGHDFTIERLDGRVCVARSSCGNTPTTTTPACAGGLPSKCPMTVAHGGSLCASPARLSTTSSPRRPSPCARHASSVRHSSAMTARWVVSAPGARVTSSEVDNLVGILRDPSRSLSGPCNRNERSRERHRRRSARRSRPRCPARPARLGCPPQPPQRLLRLGGARLNWPPTSGRRVWDRCFWRSDVAADGFVERRQRMLSRLSTARTHRPGDRRAAPFAVNARERRYGDCPSQRATRQPSSTKASGSTAPRTSRSTTTRSRTSAGASTSLDTGKWCIAVDHIGLHR